MTRASGATAREQCLVILGTIANEQVVGEAALLDAVDDLKPVEDRVVIDPSIRQEEGVDGQQGQQEARRLPGKASQTICRTHQSDRVPMGNSHRGEPGLSGTRSVVASVSPLNRDGLFNVFCICINAALSKSCHRSQTAYWRRSRFLARSQPIPKVAGRSERRSAPRRPPPGPLAWSGVPDFLPHVGRAKGGPPHGLVPEITRSQRTNRSADDPATRPARKNALQVASLCAGLENLRGSR